MAPGVNVGKSCRERPTLNISCILCQDIPAIRSQEKVMVHW
jgi:hypothetical protein